MDEKYKDEGVLRRLYHEENLNQVEISEKLCCNPGSISYWMKKHGIETRSGSEAKAGKKIDVTDRNHKILTGLMMSDANANKSATTSIEISMSNKKFIEWLDRELGEISNGINIREFDDNRKTHYRINTKALKVLDKYRNWYKNGGKIWPSDIYLYPTTLKMLYVGDGTKAAYDSGRPYIKICMKNEHKNKEKINLMFERIGFYPKWNGYSVWFNNTKSKKVWDYMGSPPAGFKYKWPSGYKNAQH